MNYIRKHLSTILLGLMFLVGLGLLAYPTVANWWNSWNAARVGEVYNNIVESMSQEEMDSILNAADQYNDALIANPGRYYPTDSEHADYEAQLAVDGSSVMGTINVPTAKISLPIYHGTSEETLAAGAGHLEGSSLPVGGMGTHAVITGHRGLPSAKLFTDLDQVVEGDHIVLKILNETLTYEVDTIQIVLPEEMDSLRIDPDQDLLTLVTCTPYGINSHRMLVTGHRVENDAEWEALNEARQIDSRLVAIGVAVPILLILFIFLMVRHRRPKEKGKEN